MDKQINLENLSLALSAIKADYTNKIEDSKSLFLVSVSRTTQNNETVYVCSHTRGECQNAYESGQLVYTFLSDSPLFYNANDHFYFGNFWGINPVGHLVNLFFRTGNASENYLDLVSVPLITGPYPTEAEMEEMLQEMGFVNPLISNYDNAIHTEPLT